MENGGTLPTLLQESAARQLDFPESKTNLLNSNNPAPGSTVGGPGPNVPLSAGPVVYSKRIIRLPKHGFEKTWYKRVLSPMEEGSERGSIATLIATGMGAGVLSLPWAFAQNGIVMTTIYLLLATSISVISLTILMMAGR
jgi:hypothetical protein